jgi:hypothetical protein
MINKPLVVNDHLKCEETYDISIRYLENHPETYKKIARYLWAYHEIGDLIPQTLDNIFSGHYFPYTESYYELENSYELALQGFYVYSLTALRSILELGLLVIYFAVDDKEEKDVRPWITSRDRTPKRNEIFSRFEKMATYKSFDEKFGLAHRISDTFDKLDKFVHTRGYRYSLSSLTISNFNQFSEKALFLYIDLMTSVITDIIIVILLKYPIGMQALPIAEKYGLNGPVGGFLEEHQVTLITSLISPKERDCLQKLSYNNNNVQKMVEYFDNLPKLTTEELKKQSEEWDKAHPESSRRSNDIKDTNKSSQKMGSDQGQQ